MFSKKSIVVILSLLLIAFVANASGMNRVVLKQIDGNGSPPLLKQEMFCRIERGKQIPLTNTIFVIQSNFDLAEEITIPTGCVLEFEGGSLRKGRLNLNGCFIDAGLYQVFEGIDLNSTNTYNGQLKNIDNIYIKVLAGNSFVNKKTNSIIAANSIVNRRYTYKITGRSNAIKIEGKTVSVIINGQKYSIAELTDVNTYKLIYDYSRIIAVNPSGEMAAGVVKSLRGLSFYSIAPLSYNNNSIVNNKEIHPEWFGAKGDNKSDDSFAFNTALDLAYYSDSKVVIGNGVYRIDDALVIHTHTNLEGVVPTVEHPVKGCFSVNTDIAMLVFDQNNPSGSYILNNIGFIPFSNKYKSNYIGIKVYHSQNHARISNVGFYYPKTGIDIDAIGGVQLLRCEDISLWGEENKGIVAVASKYRLAGWFNANYIRPAFVANSTVIKCEGGGDNTLDGGSCETNSLHDYLIELDNSATLLVRGGLYKETGRIAKLRNSSKLIFEGDSYLYGTVDCDATSYAAYSSRNIQSRQTIINNSVVNNDVVIAHYKVFPKNTNLWFETVSNKIVKPLDLAKNYQIHRYNGRIYTSGKCSIPMGGIDIKGKTIALRVISPKEFTSMLRSYPFTFNAEANRESMMFSQGRSLSLENTAILYAPGEVSIGAMEKGERYVFIPSKQEKYILNDFVSVGDPSFLISDIYVIDKDSKDIVGNEELRIMDIMASLDDFAQYEGFLSGYNKGNAGERPLGLTKEDAGFEYFDTTLHKPIYWSGDYSVGDKGWVDALGNHPSKK